MSAVMKSAAEPSAFIPSSMPLSDFSFCSAFSACCFISALATSAIFFSCSRTFRYIWICASVRRPSAGAVYSSLATSLARSIVPRSCRSLAMEALSASSFALHPDSPATTARVRQRITTEVRRMGLGPPGFLCAAILGYGALELRDVRHGNGSAADDATQALAQVVELAQDRFERVLLGL